MCYLPAPFISADNSDLSVMIIHEIMLNLTQKFFNIFISPRKKIIAFELIDFDILIDICILERIFPKLNENRCYCHSGTLSRAMGLKDTNGKEEHKFEHPWIHTALMFLGKLRCM